MCSTKQCPECSSTDVNHLRMRVDGMDPSIKVCVMMSCNDCQHEW